MTFSFGSQSIVKLFAEPGVIRIALVLVETTPAAVLGPGDVGDLARRLAVQLLRVLSNKRPAGEGHGSIDDGISCPGDQSLGLACPTLVRRPVESTDTCVADFARIFWCGSNAILLNPASLRSNSWIFPFGSR